MNINQEKVRASRNRTLHVTEEERQALQQRLHKLPLHGRLAEAPVGTICGDCHAVVQGLPPAFADLLILDPPYNLTKNFHGLAIRQASVRGYSQWLDTIIQTLIPSLRPHATIYICGDWLTSASIFEVASRYFHVQNRITWEREKGRGAQTNWKNCSEDIWFCTVNKNDYTFHADAVRLRRRVLAPYRQNDGSPKDWLETDNGKFRDTAPSNLWTDITIPFWSMPENTDHPTQKSEKLIAKLILASSNEGDFVFDPFLGSGTTTVTAKKLGRNYLGIDSNEDYCLLAEKRLEQAESDKSIQGYTRGVFWERNSFSQQTLKKNT